jgi:hypothetical protein
MMHGARLARALKRVGLRAVGALLIGLPGITNADPVVPSGTGPLPDLQGNAKVGATLTAQYTNSYKSVLPPEIAELVAAGQFVSEVVLRPKRKDLFGAGKGGTASLVSIDSRGGLQPPPTAVTGSLLADSVGDSQVSDQAKEAYALLWNAAVQTWKMRSLSVAASLTSFVPSSEEASKVDFQIQRIYPQALGVSPGTLKPFFREKISALQPAVLKGLTWLTLRFHGTDEDYMWAASPVTGQVRQLTGSNRADSMYSGAFSPDDLWVWSGKIEMVTPTSVSSQALLVPVVEGVPTSQTQGSCLTSSYGKGNSIELNFASRRYTEAPGWNPTSTKLVLRNVVKIDLQSRDPFSVDARQRMYLDAETSLPVYKIVWGLDGKVRKIVIGILGTVATQEGAMPGWRGEVIITPPTSGHSVLIVNGLDTCSKLFPGRDIINFDPSTIGEKSDVAKKPQATPTPVVNPESIEPVDE